ncbi:MAG: VCBS repeat-containing protein [Bacteroidota bacterium]
MLNFFTCSIGFAHFRSAKLSFFGVPLLFQLISCQNFEKNNSHKNVPDQNINKGKILAATYCQSCHLLPDPSLLDAQTWETGVLPAMGPRFGIHSYGFQKYPSYKNDAGVPAGYYPDKQTISHQDWQNIIDYYTSLSPDTLTTKNREEKVSTALSTFKAVYPANKYTSPAICLTRFDSSLHPNKLWLFDLAAQTFFTYEGIASSPDTFKTTGSFVDIDFRNAVITGCNIDVINPNNGRFGKAEILANQAVSNSGIQQNVLISGLARPVQISSSDLNVDGKIDYLVCEFGHLTGALSWFEQTANATYSRHVLRAEPGAIKAYVEDVNHDGLPDVWALFTQGDEGIFLFTNKGNGVFSQQQVLRFPSVYGSTHFELIDFNGDGHKDIIYTCGDNADFSLILKPYHGVYIYLNDGLNNFKQEYFFHINGCYKSAARDFDKDGDIDIATIAFFADYATQPDEGFIYLENQGGFKFEPKTLPDCRSGRWLTMDTGDLDGDGKLDIALGNFSIRPSVIQPTVDWTSGPQFLVLKNIAK